MPRPNGRILRNADFQNLPYRLIAFGGVSKRRRWLDLQKPRGLQIRDTAGCNPALPSEEPCPAPKSGQRPGRRTVTCGRIGGGIGILGGKDVDVV